MRRVALAMVLGILLAPPASAAELTGTLKKIKDTKTMVLGYRDASRPFSFVGDDGRPAGYSVDLCLRIAAAVQKDLGLPDLQAKWVKVTPENRIRAVVDGTIDLECGSTTASLSRQEQVDFTSLTFVDGGSLLVTDASGIDGVKDENGTADAYASDRVILIALGRRAKDPSKLALSLDQFSYEPYGFMLRRDDAAFRLAANRALARLYRSDDIVPIYEKWFGDMGRPSVAIQVMYAITAAPE